MEIESLLLREVWEGLRMCCAGLKNEDGIITHQMNTTTYGVYIAEFSFPGESQDKRTPNPPPEAQNTKQKSFSRHGRAARMMDADAVEIGIGDPF